MTYNIRINTPFDGPRSWPFRKDEVADLISEFVPQVLGVQEATIDMLEDLTLRLPSYSWTGVGRKDGDQKGEFSAIFYDHSRLYLRKSSTFWLSKTPDVPGSRDWGAGAPRVTTWAEFATYEGHEFFVFNTHFDHRSSLARKKSAELIMHKVKSIVEDKPFIIMGDFNDERSSSFYRLFTRAKIADAEIVSKLPHMGPSWSFHMFWGLIKKRLDYIFTSASHWRVKGHQTIAKKNGRGEYPSDHLPVLTRLLPQGTKGLPSSYLTQAQ